MAGSPGPARTTIWEECQPLIRDTASVSISAQRRVGGAGIHSRAVQKRKIFYLGPRCCRRGFERFVSNFAGEDRSFGLVESDAYVFHGIDFFLIDNFQANLVSILNLKILRYIKFRRKLSGPRTAIVGAIGLGVRLPQPDRLRVAARATDHPAQQLAIGFLRKAQNAW